MSAGAPLVQALSRLPRDWFAVVDGAYFDNLPLVLQTSDLSGLPLYLEGGAPEHRDAAGFLVDLADEAAIRRCVDLLAGRPAAVYWSWPLGRMALYRHLRTLNLVEIPNETRESEDDPAYETVLFRHWDPNVLGSLLPLLTLSQRARFLGAATGLAFDAPAYAGLMAAPRPAGLPPAPHGYLRFSAEQMEGLRDARLSSSHRAIAAYLRRTEPEGTDHFNDTALIEFVQRADYQGRELGVSSERAHGLWAWLILVTGGEAARDPKILGAFQNTALTGDQTVEYLVDSISAWEQQPQTRGRG